MAETEMFDAGHPDHGRRGKNCEPFCDPPQMALQNQGRNCDLQGYRWYRLPGSNGGPPDPQSGALTN